MTIIEEWHHLFASQEKSVASYLSADSFTVFLLINCNYKPRFSPAHYELAVLHALRYPVVARIHAYSQDP